MTDLNYLAILVATVAAFVVSGTWYGVFGSRLATLPKAYAEPARSPVWTMVAEVLRSLVVAAVLAGLAGRAGIDGWGEALALGLVVWIGFPAMILSGAVLHEKVPWRPAAIHAGDWLVKLTAIAVIVGAFGS